MDKISAMRAFIRVVQTGSFSVVARQLNTTQATISKRVSALEENLQVKLLHRSSREQSLTEAGSEYYVRCLKIIDALDDAETVARNQVREPSGLLRITAPSGFSHILIAPLLKNFLEAYPKIKVDLILTNQNMDLLNNNIDIALRGGSLEDSTLVAKLLCRSSLQLVASPEYLKQHGVPKNLEDLAKHNCIEYALSRGRQSWYLYRNNQEHKIHISGNLVCDSGGALLNSAQSGIGIASIPNWRVYEDLASGKLQKVLPEYELSELPIYAVYSERKHLPLKIRCFIDYFSKHLGEHPAFSS